MLPVTLELCHQTAELILKILVLDAQQVGSYVSLTLVDCVVLMSEIFMYMIG